jgi:SAM-dependent methyltransferase
MSRKYMNDRWCVRCGRQGPTPFLKKHWRKLADLPTLLGPESTRNLAEIYSVLDIGCGNGRNTKFLRSVGFTDTVALDMAADFGFKITLGKDRFPVFSGSANVVLVNYVMMFLDKPARIQVMREIDRVLKTDGTVMFELYPAKDSHAKTEAECAALQADIIVYMSELDFETVVVNKNKFILKKL